MHKKFISCVFFGFLLLLSCRSNEEDCKARPPDPAILCTADYRPVCGCDGETYANSCQAEVRGIEDYTQGACN